MSKASEENITFRILSCIAILLIILGHLDCGILQFGGLFPYYSYHVLIFAFISGYFYRTADEDEPGAFLIRKLKRLLIPYFVINALFGGFIILLHKCGFAFGNEFNMYNLFVAPWLDGHQFGLNAPGWFIPALFLLELCNVIGRKILKVLKLDRELLVMALYLLLGLGVIFLSMHGRVYDYYRIPGRVMLMAPVFEAGRIYRIRQELWDRVNPLIYIAIACTVNAVILFIPVGTAYSAAWVNGFANPFLPYITTTTGIMLWLNVSRLIAGLRKGDGRIWSFVEYMGSHTFSVCIFHLSAFCVVNGVLAAINPSGFDAVEYGWNVYYAYKGCYGLVNIIYVFAGIAIPLILSYCYETVRGKMTGRRR